jgi:multiple sugar transport system permease protein
VRTRRLAEAFVVNAALVLAAALTLLPLLWMVAVSFMPAGESTALPPHLIPRTVTLDSYRVLFWRLAVGRYVLNSAGLAATVTVLAVLINSMAGYAFAKLRFKGRDRIFGSLLGALVIPAQIGMLPLFLLLRELGLVNTYAGVVIPGLASIFAIFLVRQYALGIPDALLDAARVDGAGEWRIYWTIVMPLCRPILVTLAVITFMGTWNDFLWPLVVLADRDMYTLPVALANLFGEHVQDSEVMMAGSVVTVLPVVVVFLCLQRYYIAGMMSGALKG